MVAHFLETLWAPQEVYSYHVHQLVLDHVLIFYTGLSMREVNSSLMYNLRETCSWVLELVLGGKKQRAVNELLRRVFIERQEYCKVLCMFYWNCHTCHYVLSAEQHSR